MGVRVAESDGCESSRVSERVMGVRIAVMGVRVAVMGVGVAGSDGYRVSVLMWRQG